MKYFLVKQSANWADEFDTEGFIITKGKSKTQVEDSLINPDIEFPVERSFGTNEEHIFESRQEYLDTIEIIEITEVAYKVLKELFKGNFGIFIDLSDEE